jgi:pimeloyl-ACP methyl ester carboxylesterase
MFARPYSTSPSSAFRPRMSLPTAGGGRLDNTAATPQRLDARRDGYVERTVITSDGVRLAVRDYGSSGAREHTVVLLHGLCLTQSSWEFQVRHLMRRWGNSIRVITYDHRGHGRSSSAAMDTYRIDQLAADLAEVLAVLNVTGPLTLAGHSMGGMTALAYLCRPADQRPVDPRGLVLVATAAGRLSERGLGRLLATRATGMVFDLVNHMPRRMDEVMQGLVQPICKGMNRFARAARSGAAAVAASALDTNSLKTAAGFLPSLKRYDEYHMLASVAAKTIVISGGADLTTPVDHARDLVAAIPGATHLHCPTGGHMLLQDESDCVSSAIDGVLGTDRESAPTAPAQCLRSVV